MDEDNHKRREVSDGIQQHESHYLASKVSTLDHSPRSRQARDKPGAHPTGLRQEKQERLPVPGCFLECQILP